MQRRYMVIWFRHLLTDWLRIRQPELENVPFVLIAPERNRNIIIAVNAMAQRQGIFRGMTAEDAKSAIPDLQTILFPRGKESRLLHSLGLWCIRYTPVVAIDLPDSLILDISGCAHLWGGEREYLKEIIFKIRERGYDARAAIADTVGSAWAVAHYGKTSPIIISGHQEHAISELPPSALRIEDQVLEKLHKLGFKNIRSFINMPHRVLRRRFGEHLLQRIAQVLGLTREYLTPIVPPVPYTEHLPCMEPVNTAKAIEIAIEQLLHTICTRLRSEGKGLRKAVLKCFRIDNRIIKVAISTTKGSNSVSHLFKLFALQIDKIEPALGIELFVLEVTNVEDIDLLQEKIWAASSGLQDTALAELLDRIAGKIGEDRIIRYLPAEHYWPERSVIPASSLKLSPQTTWRADRPRPIRLLSRPEAVEVMALLPDYPPKMFIHRGKRHIVDKAEGPERIEREWWHDAGDHRDYYAVEDQEGQRYWLFRSGHYGQEEVHWFLHGYFA